MDCFSSNLYCNLFNLCFYASLNCFYPFHVTVMCNMVSGFLSRLPSFPRISKLPLSRSKAKIQLPRIAIQM